MTIQFDDRQCSAIHVSSVLRHGERYPGADDMEDMTTLQNRIIAKKPDNSFDFINTWVNTYPPTNDKELMDYGREQLAGLGQRFRKRFDTLFADTFETVELISSTKGRAVDSATAFYGGFSGLEAHSRTPTEDNALVRFYDDCPYYETAVEDNATVLEEVNKFKVGQAYNDTKLAVQSRLGLPTLSEGNYTDDEMSEGTKAHGASRTIEDIHTSRYYTDDEMSEVELELLYDMCAFEKYGYNRTQWCDFLVDAERAVLEYAGDLKNYYEKSYGNDMSKRLACVMLDNLLSTMKQVTDQHKADLSYQNGRFMFGHSETIVPMYTALALFHDANPLLASNMDTMGSRQFKTSNIVPMAANIIFVLYACPDAETQYKYAVKLFVNEAEHNLPTCGGPVCWLDAVRGTYADQTGNCDWDGLCGIVGPTTPDGGQTTVGRGYVPGIPSTIVIAVSSLAVVCLHGGM